MDATVFIAVIGAAVLHAVWNALVKGSRDKRLSLGAVVLGHIPFAIIALFFVPIPALVSWPYLVSGIALHMGYQLFLLKSYETGDLTQVYPIARGSAPLIVALVSVIFLGVHLAPLEMFAIGIIAAGIIGLTLVRTNDGSRNAKAALFALITGCFIASYSLVDGLGARLAGNSLAFFAWLAIGNGLVMAVYLQRKTPAVLRDIATGGRALFLLGGGASFVAFAIVTWAFTQAPIATVAALRECSIIFAMLIGVAFLKERLSMVKIAATIAMVIGATLLRFG